MTRALSSEIVADARAVIARAASKGITLTLRDFTVVGGETYLDGMDPDEWIDAMTMD